MKINLKFSLVIILLVLSNAVFAFAKQSAIPIYNQEKTDIAVAPKQAQFTLRLKSNPTTGYRWFLREYDEHLVEPVDHHFQVEENNKKLMGAAGYELWTFRMMPLAFMVPRQTTIQMVYARSWEKNQAEPITFTVSSSGE
jgi:inhibitor of cysteine peptidase